MGEEENIEEQSEDQSANIEEKDQNELQKKKRWLDVSICLIVVGSLSVRVFYVQYCLFSEFVGGACS